MSRFTFAVLVLSLASPAFAQQPAAGPGAATGAPAEAAPAPVRKRRQPPPAVIPIDETAQAQKLYNSANYDGAVAAAKVALNKNEKFTPAMLVMAKAYYKLGKTEWVRTLWDMMQQAGASEAEKAEMYQLLAFMERGKQNGPGAIEMLKKATVSRPENAIMWNNLGAQYLEAKNFKEAAPALERAVQLQPAFAKAHLNLGNAYRGLKDYERAQAEYQKALQLFPNYADAVFNLGILFLDAEKMPNVDATAKYNAALGYFQRYKQMMSSAGQSLARDPVDQYVAEAQEGIKKEQRRIERQKKQEERDKQRAAQKTPAGPAGTPAANAQPAAGAPAGATPAGATPPGAAARQPAPGSAPAAPKQ
jgi:tetratricopeptide (TPR) repeat protein